MLPPAREICTLSTHRSCNNLFYRTVYALREIEEQYKHQNQVSRSELFEGGGYNGFGQQP